MRLPSSNLTSAGFSERLSDSISPMTARERAHTGVLGRLVFALAFAFLSAAASAQATDEEGPLSMRPSSDTAVPKPTVTNDTIIRMTRAGLDDAIIVQTIQTQAGHYDVGPEDLIALKKAGVSERVLSAMQARAAGLGFRPERTARGVVPGAIAPALEEVGVYYKDRQGDWVPLKTERVVFKSSGWLKSTATYNIVKEDMNGHLDGARSPLVLPTGVEIIIYTTPGTDAAEYDLLRFIEKKDSREFRTKTGGVFHSESGSARNEIEFKPERIAPQMYRFKIPVDIQKGEYGVLPPGSANQRGFADTGKIFTFSISE